MKPIRITDLHSFNIGHAQDNEAKTGVTVLYFKEGARVGVDISGGGPASRETPLASPVTADNPVNAVVLGGGSAFGLAACEGVMKCLEDHDIGLETGYAKVPLVIGSCIYDLGYGRSDVRPGPEMGYQATLNALKQSSDVHGNIGAGTGATAGKLLGMKQASKTGLGISAIQVGELTLAAVVAVNAVGEIYDGHGHKLAGVMNPQRTAFLDEQQIMNALFTHNPAPRTNTTIGAIITNAKLDKAQLTKVASMTRNAYARCIDPVGTMMDGDTIYTCSTGEVIMDINIIGTLAAKVMQAAIIDAVTSSALSNEEYMKYCL